MTAARSSGRSGPDRTTSCTCGASGSTVEAGEDYKKTRGRLTFNSLETERTVTVPILDDDVEDTGETFTLTLSNPQGAAIADGEGEATGTIHNSEIQPLTATFEDVPAAHDGSAFTFRMAFSENIGISYRSLREDAFAVSGGRVTRGRRVDDRRDLFETDTGADASRLRLVLEGGRSFALGEGAVLTPALELGLRHDGGDAETGTGVEVGGRIATPRRGLRKH